MLSLALLTVSVMQTSASNAGSITFAPAPKKLAAPLWRQMWRCKL
ncbi:MAG: hypothetical protein R2911_08535 [Caldilineaceae bacterium]